MRGHTWASVVLLLATAASSSAPAPTPHHQFFVDAARGSDTGGDGTAARPWQTVNHAATAAAAAARGAAAAPVTAVTLTGGIYTESLFFGPALSGTPSAPITFRGTPAPQQPQRAVLSGGLALPRSAFKPRAAGPAGALTLDLASLGLNVSELGALAPGTLGQCAGDKAELVEDGVPMSLARWPNANASAGGYPGFNNWGNVRGVWGSGGGEAQAFTLVPNASDHRPPSCPGRPRAACPPFGPVPTAKQLAAWAGEEDLWFHGYWQNDWGDSYVKAAAIDQLTGLVNISKETAPCYPVTMHARVMAVNAESELDVPGEYFISRAGVLSLIPSSSHSPTSSYVLTQRGPTQCVLCLKDASHLVFENLEAGYSRGTPVSCTDCTDVTFRNMTVRATGGAGIAIDGGSSCEVSSNEVVGASCCFAPSWLLYCAVPTRVCTYTTPGDAGLILCYACICRYSLPRHHRHCWRPCHSHTCSSQHQRQSDPPFRSHPPDLQPWDFLGGRGQPCQQ